MQQQPATKKTEILRSVIPFSLSSPLLFTSNLSFRFLSWEQNTVLLSYHDSKRIRKNNNNAKSRAVVCTTLSKKRQNPKKCEKLVTQIAWRKVSPHLFLFPPSFCLIVSHILFSQTTGMFRISIFEWVELQQRKISKQTTQHNTLQTQEQGTAFCPVRDWNKKLNHHVKWMRRMNVLECLVNQETRPVKLVCATGHTHLAEILSHPTRISWKK